MRPDPNRLRVAFLMMAGAAIGVVTAAALGHVFASRLIAAVAIVIAIGCLSSATLSRAVANTGKRTGHIVGTGMTWILLAAFFYTYVLAGRIVLALLRRDPLRRRFPAPDRSLWRPAAKPGGSRRQF